MTDREIIESFVNLVDSGFLTKSDNKKTRADFIVTMCHARESFTKVSKENLLSVCYHALKNNAKEDYKRSLLEHLESEMGGKKPCWSCHGWFEPRYMNSGGRCICCD